MKVLVVEDDPALSASLARTLAFEGYEVQTAHDGEGALVSVARGEFGCVIMDVGLPGISGLETVRRLRSYGDRTPVLMLTARQLTGDRVAGLDAGADDYVVKPFQLDELLARLRALIRRSASESEDGPLRVDDLHLDPKSHEVWRGGREIVLTHTEFLLLELLMRHQRQVLSRAQILQHVWGYDFDPVSNILEVFVGYVRRKTEAAGEPRLLHTVRGAGYVVKAEAR